jgi:hypothetical protein
MIDNEIPVEAVEAMMGHNNGSRTVYIDRSPNRLSKWYQLGEKNLLIYDFQEPQEPSQKTYSFIYDNSNILFGICTSMSIG